MFRPLFLAGLVGSTSLSAAALTVTFDPPPTVNRVTAKTVALGGTLNLLTGVTASPIGISIVVLTATGPGKAFGIGDVTVNGAVLGGMPKGRFTGTLFTLPIAPTTPLGTYTGTYQVRLQLSRTNSQTSGVTPFSFTVAAPPPKAVPEPASLAALGLGLILFRRRR